MYTSTPPGLRINDYSAGSKDAGLSFPDGRLSRTKSSQAPLVSVLIPAYNSTYFEEALKSALNQTYDNLQVLVLDDSPGTEIKQIADRLHNRRLTYVRNPKNLGFSGNFTKCLQMAKGEYIKFLNDDDILLPNCISSMVSRFVHYGERLKLVTSRRHIINEHGQFMQDIYATTPIAMVESYITGTDLANYVLKHSTNFIGEPTTAMFRKNDLHVDPDSIFRLNDREYHCLADLSLWFRLLSKGDAVYIPDGLSLYRFHFNQEQRKPEVAVKCITERYHIIKDGKALGFLRAKEIYISSLLAAIRIFNDALSRNYLNDDDRKEIRQLNDSMIKELDNLEDQSLRRAMEKTTAYGQQTAFQ